jgi:hypothetical protein
MIAIDKSSGRSFSDTTKLARRAEKKWQIAYLWRQNWPAGGLLAS